MIDHSMIISYPNQIGDCGRYTLRDQREYFKKFEGGAVMFFHLALHNVLSGDLLDYVNKCTTLYDLYSDHCEIIFNNHYDRKLEDNTISKTQYADDSREFNRRIYDIYRYAKTSVSPLLIDKNNIDIKKIWHNSHFDTGTFIIK